MSTRLGLRLLGGIRTHYFSASCSVVLNQHVTGRKSLFSSKTSPNLQLQTKSQVKPHQASSESLHNFAAKLNWSLSSEDLLINALTHKSSVSDDATLGSSFQHNERLVFLGYQTMSTFVAEILYVDYPTLTDDQLWDVQNGLLQDVMLAECAKKLGLHDLIFAKDAITDKMIAEALLAVVGSLYMDQTPSLARQFVKDNIIAELTENMIKELCQLEHPKFMLHMLHPQEHGCSIQAKVLEKSVNKDIYGEETKTFKVGIDIQEEPLAEAEGSSQLQAEKNACRKFLKANYSDTLKNAMFPLQYKEYVSESEVNFGLLAEGVRHVELQKGDSGFGFLVKGGKMKSKETKDYAKYSYYVPPFVSGITEEGPAERCQDLRVGDVILAINDKITKGMSHPMVVDLLGSIKGKVKLTVKFSKKVLIFDELETRFSQFKEKKLLSQLSNTEWAEWHHAHARENEGKYYDALFREGSNGSPP